MDRPFPSDIAFTESVKAIQSRKGSRSAYARLEQRRPWQTTITAELRAFIDLQRSVFLATASADAQPYIQHRGGPAGFLHVLNDRQIAFADLVGNRQYITQGNLAENAKAHLFLIDYAQRRRIKVWGDATVIEGDESLMQRLIPANLRSPVEQAIVFTVTAWDANCPRHIPRRFDAQDVQAALAERDRRIAELENELIRRRGGAQA